MSLFFYLPISHTWMGCFYFFPCFFFLKKTYCLFHRQGHQCQDSPWQCHSGLQMPCAGEGGGPVGYMVTQPNLLGDVRDRGAPAESGRHGTLSISTNLFSDQWNTSELKSRRVWHRSGCESQTIGCEIGTIADRGEMAAESLGSLFLMHNTCVHSFVYFAGIFRKPYNIPQTTNLNCFWVKNY